MKVEFDIYDLETGDIIIDKDSPNDFMMAIYTNGYWSAYHLEQNCIKYERMRFADMKDDFRIICKNENCKITLR